MPPWAKGLIAATIIAIVVVVWVESSNEAKKQKWSTFHRAAQGETSLDDLEDLRRDSSADDLEPWVSLELALQLYEEGDVEQIRRAAQVASEALEQHPDHPIAPQLATIRDVASTYGS